MSTRDDPDRLALMQGTLDVLILRTLHFRPEHGQGIARAIQQTSDGELLVDHGALYPALQRLEAAGLDLRQVGHVREQPEGAVLHPHQDRPRAARARVEPVAPARGRDGPRPRTRTENG